MQRAHQKSAVDHDWPLLLALLIDVKHVKSLWKVEVKLHSGALPLAAKRVLDLDVDLGAVEGTAALRKGRWSEGGDWVGSELAPKVLQQHSKLKGLSHSL